MIDILQRSILVALIALLWILIPAVALAYWTARSKFPGKSLLEAILNLPMVLPPVAVGLILLSLFSVHGPLSGLTWLFTWKMAAVASGVMAFPLLYRSAHQAFREIPRRYEQVGKSLGAPRCKIFFQISLPLASRGIGYGAVLSFLRALGEFGATSLVAGNIPGQTQTLSLAIYSAVNRFDDSTAWSLCGLSMLVALIATWAAERFLHREVTR